MSLRQNLCCVGITLNGADGAPTKEVASENPATSAREKCRVLNRVLFHEWGFHGNVENYTDPRNSFLDHVADDEIPEMRRRDSHLEGPEDISVSLLRVLYVHVVSFNAALLPGP